MSPREETSAWSEVTENRQRTHQAQVTQHLFLARGEKVCIRSSCLQCVRPQGQLIHLATNSGLRGCTPSLLCCSRRTQTLTPQRWALTYRKLGECCENWHRCLRKTKEHLESLKQGTLLPCKLINPAQVCGLLGKPFRTWLKDHMREAAFPSIFFDPLHQELVSELQPGRIGKGKLPRWWSRKTLSSPPTDTPKLQLFIEQLWMRTTWRLTEKIYN